MFVVDPTQIEIEAPTDDPILTLYTCTPVWTAAQRLIVRSKLVSDPTQQLLPDEINEFVVGPEAAKLARANGDYFDARIDLGDLTNSDGNAVSTHSPEAAVALPGIHNPGFGGIGGLGL